MAALERFEMKRVEVCVQQRDPGVLDRRAACGVGLVGLLDRRRAVGHRAPVELDLELGLERGELAPRAAAVATPRWPWTANSSR